MRGGGFLGPATAVATAAPATASNQEPGGFAQRRAVCEVPQIGLRPLGLKV